MVAGGPEDCDGDVREQLFPIYTTTPILILPYKRSVLRGVCGYLFLVGGGSQPILERDFCHSRHEKGGCGKIMRKTTTASASKRRK